MGLFDSVYAPCTCGTMVEFQTKALPYPYMNQFPLNAVPLAVAEDLNGATSECGKCGATLRLMAPPLPETVPMYVTVIPPSPPTPTGEADRDG